MAECQDSSLVWSEVTSTLHREKYRRKATTLASWSNLPGKSLLIDQLARLKAKSSNNSSSSSKSCKKCRECSCFTSSNNLYWDDTYQPMSLQQPPPPKAATKAASLKKNKSSEWLNIEKSVRFNLPSQNHVYSSHEKLDMFSTADFLEDKDKKSVKSRVIVKTPSNSVNLISERSKKAAKSIFAQRFLYNSSSQQQQSNENKKKGVKMKRTEKETEKEIKVHLRKSRFILYCVSFMKD